MSRTIWVLGNWKQNHRREAAGTCAEGIANGATEAIGTAGNVVVGIAPPLLSIDAAARFVGQGKPAWLLAQDCAAQDEGAFTGETGPAMLREAGVQGAILGHSERRGHFLEPNALVARKVRSALDGGLTAVLCVGEKLDARESGVHEKTVISQLSESLSKVEAKDMTARLVVAYEPVWAIGTGRTATPEQASAMHATIRGFMKDRYGEAGADRSILYGGSVKPANAGALIAAGNIDGFLVGGASLKPDSFLAIAGAAAKTARPVSA